nr:MAG TPA: hypothetical protein [Caudoviricetes sp.]
MKYIKPKNDSIAITIQVIVMYISSKCFIHNKDSNNTVGYIQVDILGTENLDTPSLNL